MNTSTVGLTLEQLENGTPSTKTLVLKSVYKNEKMTISPAKDKDGRYHGIIENIPETKRLELGYVPTKESRKRIYDGIKINLSDEAWARDWLWMQHCSEIAEDFATAQSSPGAFFYIFRPGVEAAKKISRIERETELRNYIMKDSPEGLYTRVAMLGMDMKDSPISDVKEFLYDAIKQTPGKLRKVYETKTFVLEVLLMKALEKKVIINKKGVFTFGEVLLGVDKKAVISFLSSPANMQTVGVIESLTNGTRKADNTPLADEIINSEDSHYADIDTAADKAATDDNVEGFTSVKEEEKTPPADYEKIKAKSLNEIKDIANKRRGTK